jgi:glycosyltransferase involved in cell wall biosynthesis
MKLLVLPRYARKGPSSRLRHYQFLRYVTEVAFTVDVQPLLPDDYLDALYLGHAWPRRRQLQAFWHRFNVMMRVRRYDLIWLEKEIFPFLPATAERAMAGLRIPFVADYDDAWHLRYRHHPNAFIRTLLKRKIETIMRCATLVTAGNAYLADVARHNGARRVVEVPTVLDLDHYRLAQHGERRPVRIIWIGSSLNSRYLLDIADALRTVCKNGRAEFVVVGGRPVDLPGVPARFEPWSETDEARVLAQADIGIMPLPDTEWERGKCAFKILQYMAAGLPVVASPVGANRNVLDEGLGFLAASAPEWTHALDQLIGNVDLRARMGAAGRRKVEREYALAVWGPRVAQLLADAARAPSA